MKAYLYIVAVLLVSVPMAVVLINNTPFSSNLSRTVISIAMILIIVGKVITILEKRKVNKSYASDIGIISGLTIGMILSFI